MRALIASAGARTAHDLHAGDARRRIDDGPTRVERDLAGLDAGFLQEFAQRASLEIDAAGEDVLGIGRAGGKVDRAGVGGVRGHFAEQEGAVGADERGHREAVADLRVGKAEIAPGEKGGVVGLEIVAAQDRRAVGARLEGVAGEQQHAAVVEARLGGEARAPMRGDSLRFGLGERPRPRREAADRVRRLRGCATRSQIDRPFARSAPPSRRSKPTSARRPPPPGRARSCSGGPSRLPAR